MAIADDFTIDYVNRRVTHSSGASVYTTNELYSFLMEEFEAPEQMDDTVPMSAQTPTDYTLINGWFMDDESYTYLKGGAIKTDGYTNNVQIVTLTAGATSCDPTDVGKMVTDDAGDTGNLLAYNNTTRKWWVRFDTTIATGSVMAITDGTGAGTSTGASVTGEDLFPNIYTLGSIEEDDEQQIYVIQNGAALNEWWPETGSGTQHIDVLIKTKEAGTEIDSGKITVFLRHYPVDGYADLYDHFDIDLTAGGRNAVPLATSPDLNNTSDHATAGGYNDITIAFVNGTITHDAPTGDYTNYETVRGLTSLATGIMLKDASGTMTLGNINGVFQNGEVLRGLTSGVTSNSTATVTWVNTMKKNFIKQGENDYSVIINCATRRLSQVYEYMKYVLRENETTYQTYGIKSVGGVLSQNRLDGEQYIRAYTDLTTPANSYSPVKASPFGTFAGGKFFGARGVWVENMHSADILAFQLIDSGNTTRTPPTQAAITISNLLASDRVAVFRTSSGTAIDKAVYTLAAGNDLGNTTVVMNEDIEFDTPATGTLRIVDTSDTGATREIRYAYTSWTSKTFSGLTPALDRNYTATDDTAYVPFIDTIATGTSVTVTVIYAEDRTILIRVRRYTPSPILPFETTGTFYSTGYSTSAIRTPDTIVS